MPNEVSGAHQGFAFAAEKVPAMPFHNAERAEAPVVLVQDVQPYSRGMVQIERIGGIAWNEWADEVLWVALH
jgi:hypothetical protein